MTINSFSGAHPFNPEHLIEAFMDSMGDEAPDHQEAVEAVAVLVEAIDAGRCPRCDGAFADGQIPAGSRNTDCRCIPVCSECGRAEVYEREVLALVSGPEDLALMGMVGPVCEWPINGQAQTEALAAFDLRGNVTVPFEQVDVQSIKLRDHPGGWAEFGYDDAQDRDERER